MTKSNTLKYIEWKIKQLIDSEAEDNIIQKWVDFYFEQLKIERDNQ